MWPDLGDEITDWFKRAPLTLATSVILITSGTYLAVGQKTHSTYFCSAVLDNRIWVLSMQIAGLLLDALIAILLWRVLAWSKTTRSRLRTLAGLQWTSACAVWVIYLALRIQLLGTADEPLYSHSFMGLGWLYIFDMINDSFTVAVLIVSTSLIISETGPLKPFGVVTFASGAIAAYFNATSLQTWHSIPKPYVLLPFYTLLPGFGLFLYTTNIRSILFVRRVFILVILLGFVIGMSIYVPIVPQTQNRHPVDEFVFRARIETDRWLRHASVSDTLRVAVDEYRERNNGRDPPPNFDKWFDFAKAKKTPIIDHFQQIRDDTAPFWNLKPGVIREMSTKILTQELEVAFVRIVGQKVTHNYQAHDENREILDRLVEMIQGFVEHLGDMELPINLSDEPRALPSWANLHQAQKPSLSAGLHLLDKRREQAEPERAPEPESGSEPADPHQGDAEKGVLADDAIAEPNILPALAFQEMEAQTCPAGSAGRATSHWNVRDFCFSCTARHTVGPYVKHFERSLSRCHQPDISRLHSFHMSRKIYTPFQEVVPVFSRHKADGFSDVLIPWPKALDEKPASRIDFQARINKLHWRGELGDAQMSDDLFHGHQKHRLLHLVNNATASEEVTIMIPTSAEKKKPALFYQRVSAAEANGLLPFDVGASSWGPCDTPACAAARVEFGQSSVEGEAGDPLRHRYVLLLDSDTGPDPGFMRALRSPSVPFVSSIFRAWYTERLFAWVHFVPIDVRFQGLHSTLAYFTGLKGDEGRLPGQTVDLEGRQSDAKWIGREGGEWAARALRKEDMEVYLFRLLLEWGRIVSDDRDSLAFKLPQA